MGWSVHLHVSSIPVLFAYRKWNTQSAERNYISMEPAVKLIHGYYTDCCTQLLCWFYNTIPYNDLVITQRFSTLLEHLKHFIQHASFNHSHTFTQACFYS